MPPLTIKSKNNENLKVEIEELKANSSHCAEN